MWHDHYNHGKEPTSRPSANARIGFQSGQKIETGAPLKICRNVSMISLTITMHPNPNPEKKKSKCDTCLYSFHVHEYPKIQRTCSSRRGQNTALRIERNLKLLSTVHGAAKILHDELKGI